MRRLISIIKDDRAATAVEYGLILALIFLSMIGGVTLFGNTTIAMWNRVSETVTNA
jgi:pilus assembly protein Flp/PilA